MFELLYCGALIFSGFCVGKVINDWLQKWKS